MTTAPILAEIVEAVEGVPARGRLQAYLFGSALRAESAWSDIDILVVCEAEEDGQLTRDTMSDLCMRYPIDLVIMAVEEEVEFDFIRSEDCRWIAASRPRGV